MTRKYLKHLREYLFIISWHKHTRYIYKNQYQNVKKKKKPYKFYEQRKYNKGTNKKEKRMTRYKNKSNE